MIDVEKTISGLKEIADYFRECRNNASFASKAEEHFWVLQSAARDAAELLMKQEVVKPIKSKLSFTHGFDFDIWECGCCGNQLRSLAKYCDRCGRAVSENDNKI